MFSWRRTALRKRIIVATKTGKHFRGVLVFKRGPLLILKDTELLEERAEPAPMDGEILIERANVDFIQVLGPPAEG